ncbi:MAG: hypothetical protein DWH82_13400 [Planctomycetota bacterium]|nr:MAG: hypothetical protein DWH82_13400 [Planctomycetota bacterium]
MNQPPNPCRWQEKAGFLAFYVEYGSLWLPPSKPVSHRVFTSFGASKHITPLPFSSSCSHKTKSFLKKKPAENLLAFGNLGENG